MRRAIVPIAEIWVQSDGDLDNDLWSPARIAAHVHVEVVPREDCIKAIEHVLTILKSTPDRTIIGRHPSLNPNGN